MFMILENFRDFKIDDFPVDKNNQHIRCDGCLTLAEQYLIIESAAFCKGCLERGIKILNKNFMNHCKDSWIKRVREEENARV